MKNQRLLAVVLAVCFGSVSVGQRPDSSTTQKPPEGDVVRITTNLVQVDAVITDKNGKPITDLKPEELQLFEDKQEDYPFLLRRHRRCPSLKANRER